MKNRYTYISANHCSWRQSDFIFFFNICSDYCGAVPNVSKFCLKLTSNIIIKLLKTCSLFPEIAKMSVMILLNKVLFCKMETIKKMIAISQLVLQMTVNIVIYFSTRTIGKTLTFEK